MGGEIDELPTGRRALVLDGRVNHHVVVEFEQERVMRIVRVAVRKLVRGFRQAEASWVKLSDGSILTTDPDTTFSERYIPSLNQWISDSNCPVNLYGVGSEIGPGIYLPNGKALFLGGNNNKHLYHNSTLALNADTGKIVWYYQHIPGETQDMDEVFENILVDVAGRKSLFKMGKLGILWQLDRTTGAFDRAHYPVEKLVYESRPGFFVTANLYLPKTGAPPHPGVLFQMGHSANGKSYALYQRCCQGLVQLGYVVLAFDPIGQGERTYYTRLSPTQEHTVPGRQMLLVGETVTGALLWDAMRSLDVLASPGVFAYLALAPDGVPVVAERAYDSDPLRERFAADGYPLVAPHRKNRMKPKTGRRRRLRRYKRRWTIERMLAWLPSYRRVVTRFEHNVNLYEGFVYLACAFIALNRLV
jgi:transposase